MTKPTIVKDKIFEAAISLFNSKGYADTSIRDIAASAKANVSTISYYFHNKQGLLEYSFVTFFEPYTQLLEKGLEQLEVDGAYVCLKNTVNKLMEYQYKHFTLTRFIWRELSIDKQIVRELMSTYFMRERHYFQKIMEAGVQSGEFKKISSRLFIIQLKGMMTMPFLNSIYMAEVWSVYFQERYYFENYKKQINDWIESLLV
ncbi:forespore capture DNA-binding protein RefZ [Caldibacillus lycopersici]|uniref:Forespore capture DNA-binding protein RefZ n=1 Tax=Perspicuibacillus lycopersici TaxID=1325689 RepID=A0AAE3ITJ5_9BACI|nr:forespore capture DNA-binding protein RefZ [Perspicuibacillus lycopersici]MCU9614221.1 forespore capture DNA-binding protein RefZ [Perspicuibacillus lycopersici]